jgi:hypothetical protein
VGRHHESYDATTVTISALALDFADRAGVARRVDDRKDRSDDTRWYLPFGDDDFEVVRSKGGFELLSCITGIRDDDGDAV